MTRRLGPASVKTWKQSWRARPIPTGPHRRVRSLASRMAGRPPIRRAEAPVGRQVDERETHPAQTFPAYAECRRTIVRGRRGTTGRRAARARGPAGRDSRAQCALRAPLPSHARPLGREGIASAFHSHCPELSMSESAPWRPDTFSCEHPPRISASGGGERRPHRVPLLLALPSLGSHCRPSLRRLTRSGPLAFNSSASCQTPCVVRVGREVALSRTWSADTDEYPSLLSACSDQ